MRSPALLKKLLLTLPTLFGVLVVVFVLMRVVPGDPAALMLSSESTAQDLVEARKSLGLDRPLPVQFASYLGDVLKGDFGRSITMKQDVMELVFGRLPATLELALTALFIAAPCALLLALVAVYWRGSWIDGAVDAFNSFCLAIPEFLWAILLILAFAVLLPWLPISGRLDPVQQLQFRTPFYFFEAVLTGQFRTAGHLLSYLVLPAVALALPFMAVIARVLKSSLADAMSQDYTQLARVKGFSEARVLSRHALPNALLPTVTVTGVHFVLLVGGTVMVELIFAFPGIGNLLYTAAINRDLPLIQGVTITFAVLFVVLNTLVDLTYALLNPRLSEQ
ncbi:ABC transporter permease [Variovorax sp. VNK109]|uniref:ABC transporter permease n=1 Tax=Variovorax sp. VNK109 TaxID=3400919 RepID=UPI003C073D3E